MPQLEGAAALYVALVMAAVMSIFMAYIACEGADARAKAKKYKAQNVQPVEDSYPKAIVERAIEKECIEVVDCTKSIMSEEVNKSRFKGSQSLVQEHAVMLYGQIEIAITSPIKKVHLTIQDPRLPAQRAESVFVETKYDYELNGVIAKNYGFLVTGKKVSKGHSGAFLKRIEPSNSRIGILGGNYGSLEMAEMEKTDPAVSVGSDIAGVTPPKTLAPGNPEENNSYRKNTREISANTHLGHALQDALQRNPVNLQDEPNAGDAPPNRARFLRHVTDRYDRTRRNFQGIKESFAGRVAYRTRRMSRGTRKILSKLRGVLRSRAQDRTDDQGVDEQLYAQSSETTSEAQSASCDKASLSSIDPGKRKRFVSSVKRILRRRPRRQ